MALPTPAAASGQSAKIRVAQQQAQYQHLIHPPAGWPFKVLDSTAGPVNFTDTYRRGKNEIARALWRIRACGCTHSATSSTMATGLMTTIASASACVGD